LFEQFVNLVKPAAGCNCNYSRQTLQIISRTTMASFELLHQGKARSIESYGDMVSCAE